LLLFFRLAAQPLSPHGAAHGTLRMDSSVK
jgi:hypothetical protein